MGTIGAPEAFADTNFTPGDLSQMTDGAVTSLLRTVGIGADHRAYMPAAPLGVLLGVDMGIDVTAITVPQDFRDALVLATQRPATDVPSLLPLPKLNVHKGLPFGVDLGFTFSAYAGYFTIYGAEAQWAFVKGDRAAPAIALRAAVTYDKVWFLSNHTYKLDALISKSFWVIEPYVGTGIQYWNGDLDVPAGGSTGLPAAVSGHASGVNPHFFGGAGLKLLFLRLGAELDYSTAGVTTYGGKLSVNF